MVFRNVSSLYSQVTGKFTCSLQIISNSGLMGIICEYLFHRLSLGVRLSLVFYFDWGILTALLLYLEGCCFSENLCPILKSFTCSKMFSSTAYPVYTNLCHTFPFLSSVRCGKCIIFLSHHSYALFGLEHIFKIWMGVNNFTRRCTWCGKKQCDSSSSSYSWSVSWACLSLLQVLSVDQWGLGVSLVPSLAVCGCHSVNLQSTEDPSVLSFGTSKGKRTLQAGSPLGLMAYLYARYC